MMCENCNKNKATVFITRITDGEKKELNLCQQCAAIDTDNDKDLFENLFKEFISSLINEINFNNLTTENNNTFVKCSKCGLSFDDITKTGKIGCSDCYTVFSEKLIPAIKNIQGSITHRGKFPKKSGADLYTQKLIKDLRLKLSQKIKSEEYEAAATIRDKIKELEGAVSHE